MRQNTIAALLYSAILAAAAANANPTAKHVGDGEALAELAAIDQHEVSTARQALVKGVDGAVRDFATRMQTDHGKNLEDTRRVARENKLQLASSEQVRALQAKGRSEEQALAKLSGAAYAKAYVDAMVKGHAEVLGKLDATLIPGAQDPEVVAHLKATREAVSMHLSMAQKLQAAP